jgi:predicted DNA-binding transcriptional regulator AlpA
MARQTALPQTLAPRLIDRAASAAFISVCPNTFDQMVKDGRMPKPKVLSGRRIAWDVRDLDAAVSRLPVVGGNSTDDTWSDSNAA